MGDVKSDDMEGAKKHCHLKLVCSILNGSGPGPRYVALGNRALSRHGPWAPPWGWRSKGGYNDMSGAPHPSCFVTLRVLYILWAYRCIFDILVSVPRKSDGTTRAKHNAQQKGSTHKGLGNKSEYTRCNVWRGSPIGSDEYVDTRHAMATL